MSDVLYCNICNKKTNRIRWSQKTCGNKTCRKKYYYEYYKKYGTKHHIKRLNQERKREAKADPRNQLLWSAKCRAVKYNIPFNISIEDIVIPLNCPVFGFPLKRGNQKAIFSSPSLDRIRPELGYVKGNIQVISNKANIMKNNASIPELLKFAAWVHKEFKHE